jgi:hypothetical protein
MTSQLLGHTSEIIAALDSPVAETRYKCGVERILRQMKNWFNRAGLVKSG